MGTKADDYGLDAIDTPARIEAWSSRSIILVVWAAAASVALGTAAVGASSLRLHVTGYLLCSVLAFTLVALFRRESQRRLAEIGDGASDLSRRLATSSLVVGLATSAIHAWSIARMLS